MAEWLGHHDFCSLQWSSACDCLTPEEEAELCTCPPVDANWHMAIADSPPRDSECPLHHTTEDR